MTADLTRASRIRRRNTYIRRAMEWRVCNAMTSGAGSRAGHAVPAMHLAKYHGKQTTLPFSLLDSHYTARTLRPARLVPRIARGARIFRFNAHRRLHLISPRSIELYGWPAVPAFRSRARVSLGYTARVLLSSLCLPLLFSRLCNFDFPWKSHDLTSSREKSKSMPGEREPPKLFQAAKQEYRDERERGSHSITAFSISFDG